MQLLIVFSVCVICVECLPFGENNVGTANSDERQCGVEASPSPLHHNPWLVYLEYYKDGFRNIRCAATLITRRHVLTAAHCVRTSLYTRLIARLGEYDLRTENDSRDDIVADPVVRINVADVIIHENYDGVYDHDIAILVLEENAPYTDFIRPVCLPTGTVDRGAMLSAAGWGELPTSHVYSQVKKIIPLPYWTREACLKVYKHLDLPEGVICAGGEDGVDTCRGDSGGPLVLLRGGTGVASGEVGRTSGRMGRTSGRMGRTSGMMGRTSGRMGRTSGRMRRTSGRTGWTSGRTELWGVTSSGNVHCGTMGSPGIYTSVQHHLEWIHRVVESS